MARLLADLKNYLGGKYEVDEHGREVKSDKPPRPPESLFTAAEMRPWYAWFGDEPPEQKASMSEATAQDIMDNLAGAPAWALHLVPIDEAKRVLGRA